MLGIEGSYDWSNIKVNQNAAFAGGAGFTMTLKNDYVATVTGRVGYAFDRVLLYAKGGAEFAGTGWTPTMDWPAPSPEAAVAASTVAAGSPAAASNGRSCKTGR